MKLTLAKVLARKEYQQSDLYLTLYPLEATCCLLITFANSLEPLKTDGWLVSTPCFDSIGVHLQNAGRIVGDHSTCT